MRRVPLPQECTTDAAKTKLYKTPASCGIYCVCRAAEKYTFSPTQKGGYFFIIRKYFDLAHGVSVSLFCNPCTFCIFQLFVLLFQRTDGDSLLSGEMRKGWYSLGKWKAKTDATPTGDKLSNGAVAPARMGDA
ncbi:hypothetical protein POVWA2_046220 [Plasmodium ovale wallikeri]|uniref:Uncharacterized protein n=1 Tax=Plasmodium ovale wallikeri TaxID=864142 RepID=A0A1A8ZIE2_PLAOA|nr:hypothetical protein POVWA1_047290 [Plasmodium ovale wallikeri]SBT43611.1 hypothetical protein POVWA2_046220 [Plasmodium ovale wallikeri]